MAQSLIEHETISTTVQKAKEIKPFVEKLITLAKKGSLQYRRRAISMLGDRSIVAFEDGEPVEKGTVIGKLFSELGPRYLDRSGGYTRIIRLSLRRLGDNGQVVLLQLLGKDEPLKKEKRAPGKRRSRKRAGQAAGTRQTGRSRSRPRHRPKPRRRQRNPPLSLKKARRRSRRPASRNSPSKILGTTEKQSDRITG